MANIVFASDNLAVGSTITLSSEESNHPKARLTDYYMWKQCWLNAGTGNIVIDLGSAKAVQCAALIHTNLTSGMTIGIQGNASDSWGAPSYDETITYKERNQVKIFSSAETYRYWRFTFGGGSLSNVKIGQIFLGPIFQPEINFGYNYSRQKARAQVSNATPFNVRRTYTLGQKQDTLTLPFKPPRADLESIEEMWDEDLQGGALPCLVVPDPDDTGDQIAWYGKLPTTLAEQFNEYKLYDYGEISIQFIEEPALIEA